MLSVTSLLAQVLLAQVLLALLLLAQLLRGWGWGVAEDFVEADFY